MRTLPDNKQSALLTEVRELAGFEHDAQLAAELEIGKAAMSRLRHGKQPLGASTIVRIHELTGLPIREIKERAGLECLPRVVVSAEQECK